MKEQPKIKIWPGDLYPLGATWREEGINFALFSENATKVELCLFESSESRNEYVRIPLEEHTDQIWHCFIPGLKPGVLYGYRVHGPYDPSAGQRFNPNKVLLDPYARAIGRPPGWGDEMFPYRIGDSREDLSFDDRDNAATAALSAVIDQAFDWGEDKFPKVPWHSTLIYELHVKGFTKLHPELPESIRGTYAGLASEPMIKYLKDLGVTTVELMPVHYRTDDRHLMARGLSNYWGYNTLSFFSPDERYAASATNIECVNEFKSMIKTLHAAGIEVILDVVYNHTSEGNHLGPMFSFRGIDNASYYRLVKDNRRYYEDFTGTGNTLNMQHPRVLQLLMDSLRYWVNDMHVDGFRFDLASALARELYDVNKLSAFFDVICQDPVLSQVKLIAEPWDLGQGGYQVGNFPVGWTEWNGKYRDAVRRFWKGEGGTVGEFATRLSGSSDLYEQSGRLPHAGINFITCHDGFTLNDLVSHDHKHNEANGDNNKDGSDDNMSWNCGAEGASNDAAVLATREKQKRNFLATLFLSQGVPMLLHGDEIGRTQHGNNNAYCQDTDLAWVHWDLSEDKKTLLLFTRRLVNFWKKQPVLRRRKFFQGRAIRGMKAKDVVWIDVNGKEMGDETWNQPLLRSFGMLLDGDAIAESDEHGDRIRGDSLLVLLNSSPEKIRYTLPSCQAGWSWHLNLNTADPAAELTAFEPQTAYQLDERSLAVFIRLEKSRIASATLAERTNSTR